MKKLLLGLITFVVAITLIGCSFEINDNPKPDTPDTPVEDETKLDNFVIVLPDGAQTRVYKENFDDMIEDFSTASAASVKSHLRVAVDNTLENPANSADAAIYKMATGVYPIESFDGIGFRIRKLGEGKISLSNLVLALRGDDAYDTYPINLAEAVNPDGEALSELTGEYQDLIVCPNLSIEDDTTVYQLAGGAGASETKVLEKILGFHLYLTGECSQIIEIEEVFLVKGADRTVLDAFNREKVNKTDDTCWWRDSRGFIVQQGFEVNKGTSYTIHNTTDKENLVLNVMGDTTTATLGGKAWSELKDANGNPVVNAVNGAFFPLVINLKESGLEKGDLVLTSDKELVLSKVYTSNLEDREIVTKYPEIDTENVAMIDNFNREQSGFDGDYDKSISNPVVIAAGLNYALSYNHGDKVSVANGYVTFDGIESPDYINFKEGKTVYTDQKYLVLVVKATDGATFNDFRFDIGNGIFYINQMYSAFGLPLPKADDATYPYIDANGFMWLIIDLAESGMVPNATDGFIDFYYTGTGKLLIDAAFYCDEKGPSYDKVELTEIQGEIVDGYKYVGAFNPAGAKLVTLDFTSDSEATLETLRIEGADGAKWFKDGQIIDKKGNVVDAKQKLAGLSITIDLVASGLNPNDWNHIHGGLEGAVTGAFTLKITGLVEKSNLVKTVVNELDGEIVDGYLYQGGFSTDGAKLAVLEFTSDSDATLETLRLEGNDGAKWFKDGQIIDDKGNVIDATQKLAGLTIIIDLEASGLNPNGWNHLHGGLEGAVTGTYHLVVSKLEEPAKFEAVKLSDIDGEIVDGYKYVGAFNPAGAKLVTLEFTTDSEATLETLRIEGADGAKWFKDNQIIDDKGNVIDATQKLAGLKITIDLVASGLNPNDWNHIHGGLDGAVTGTFTVSIYALVEVNNYTAIMNALVQ